VEELCGQEALNSRRTPPLNLLKEVVRPASDVGSLVNFSEEFSLELENSTEPDEIAAKLARTRTTQHGCTTPSSQRQNGLQNKSPPINGN